MKVAACLKLCLTLTGLSISLLLGGCATLEPRAERLVPPSLGSTWEIAQRNTGSFGKDAQIRVTRGEANWQGMPQVAMSNSLGITTIFSPEGGQHAIVGREGKPLMSWEPPIGFQFPLTVGKTWTTSHKLTVHPTGKTFSYNFSCKVESYEDVAVAAGTFKAFKVPCLTTIGTEEAFWFSPDLGIHVKINFRRTDKSPFGPGTQETELLTPPVKK